MTKESRIELLETQVRILKRLFWGLGCLMIAGLAIAATSLQSIPEVLTAKRFAVVNDEGRVTARLYSDENGGVLYLFNKDGTRTSALAALPNGGGALVINSQQMKPVAVLSAKDDAGAFYLLDKDKKPTFAAP